MKNIKYIIPIIFLWGMLSLGCNKSVLDQQGPKTALTLAATFSNYNSFLTYTWNFYNVFPAYDGSLLNYDLNSDLFEQAAPNSQSTWISQLVTIPGTDGNYSGPYSNIRAINLMLDNIDNSSLTTVQKSHMRSIGDFFRAYNYANLLNLYGAVPYISTALTDTSKSALYEARTPRDSVAQYIMNDLNYASNNISGVNDGPNTINQNVVLALISRFGLREGTWREYHGLSNANDYLQASADASVLLMAAFPALMPNYDLIFNSSTLANQPGIILYKQYVTNQITHNLSTAERNGSVIDLTKAAMNLFLCTNGQPAVPVNPEFEGDHSPYTEFRNRDLRLYYDVNPPYIVNTPSATSTTFTYTNNPIDTSYFGLMESISDPQHKTLPTINYAGQVIKESPHFMLALNGQNGSASYTGYRFYKFADRLTGLQVVGGDINNAPIFRMGEVLVNYAEATYELGTFTQTICDATINKLRARGGVAPLDLSNIPNDPNRDSTVSPILWEIRRGRSIELLGEGFRWDDLRRWDKMSYVTNLKLGMYIFSSEYPSLPILNGADSGYLSYEPQPPAIYPDYYYLHPIPSQEIVLNPKLVQNPGWQ